MKRFFIALIRFYQKHLSGRKKHPTCLYTPTCSCYALEAFEKRGAFVGLALSVWRLLRCNPFSRGGYDPVPDKGFGRKIKYRDLDRLAAQMRARGEMTFQYDNKEATGDTTESVGGCGSFKSGPSQDLTSEEANAECQKGSLPPRPDTTERQTVDCGAVPSEDQPERHPAKRAQG